MTRFFGRLVVGGAALGMVVLGFLAGPLATVHAAGVTETLNVADLTPCCGNPEPNASGVARSISIVKTGVGELDLFSTTLTIPQTSSSSSNPPPAISIILSRGGQNYAECVLVPVQHEQDGNAPNDSFGITIVKVSFNSGSRS